MGGGRKTHLWGLTGRRGLSQTEPRIPRAPHHGLSSHTDRPPPPGLTQTPGGPAHLFKAPPQPAWRVQGKVGKGRLVNQEDEELLASAVPRAVPGSGRELQPGRARE